jgi:hypothetical protein
MNAQRGELVARQIDGDLEIGNNRIRARFVRRDGGYAQEFYAIDRIGNFRLVLSSLHKNLIAGSEHRVCSSPMIAGERPHLFAVCRESLRMVYSAVDIVRHDEDAVTAQLTGTVQEHSLTCRVSIARGSNVAHIFVSDEINSNGADPLVEYLMSSYAFLPDGCELRIGETIDYAWVPNLRPGDDHVIGDYAFRSPAVVVRKGRVLAALIPDLETLSADRPMPFAVDLDLKNGLLPAPLLSCGFCGYEEVEDGRYFRHDITMAKRIPGARLSYSHDLLLYADCKQPYGYEVVARFLWARYGQATMKSIHPSASKVQLGHSCSYARSDRYRGRSIVGSNLSVNRQVPLLPDAWAAYGLYVEGANQGSNEIILNTKTLTETVLSAPQVGGLFHTRFDLESRQWVGCNSSECGAQFHAAECSTQLLWLLNWYTNIEKDARIIRLARSYADFLISARLRSGAIPSCYGADLVPVSTFRFSAETAVSALFLGRLASVTGIAKYARSVERSARFVLTEIIPKHAYMDHSLMSDVTDPDPHSGARPQSGWAMLWAAQMCFVMYDLTQDRNYITHGLAALDQLCLLQSVGVKTWQPLDGNPGLCAMNNVGSRLDAELTIEFARCLMDYGAVTGESEYFERGASALVAACTDPNLPDISKARIAASAALIRDRYGSAFVHVGRKWGVWIGTAARLDVAFGRGSVEVNLNGDRDASRIERIVFGGMRGSSYKVRVGEFVCDTYSSQEMARGLELPIDSTSAASYADEVETTQQLSLEGI